MRKFFGATAFILLLAWCAPAGSGRLLPESATTMLIHNNGLEPVRIGEESGAMKTVMPGRTGCMLIYRRGPVYFHAQRGWGEVLRTPTSVYIGDGEGWVAHFTTTDLKYDIISILPNRGLERCRP